MQNVHGWLAEYGESHRNPVNKTIHWICVPLIYWSVFALLWAIPAPQLLTSNGLNWAVLALVLVQAYYFVLSPKLGIGLLLVNVLVYALTWWLAATVPVPIWVLALVVFVAAWIGQFIGHHIEKKKPSFFKDIQFLLIGPAWLMGHLYRRLGISF